MKKIELSNASICPRCLSINECAIANNEASGECWCMQVPKIELPIKSTTANEKENSISCYCKICLQLFQENK